MRTTILESTTGDAPTASDSGVSIIANVRTEHQQTKDSSVEFRCSSTLKAAFKAKAKRDHMDMSEIFTHAMEDYIAGESLGVRGRTPTGRTIQDSQAAQFRRRQAEILNLLVDLRALLAASVLSPLMQEAVSKLLIETERTSRASFNLLARHVR